MAYGLIFENKKDAHYTMSDNKLINTIMDAAVLTSLTTSNSWIAKKVVKENFTSDPSSSAMNYAKFMAVLKKLHSKNTLKTKKFFQLWFRKKNVVIIPMAHSYFYLRALSTVAVLQFVYTISYYSAEALNFIWLDVIDDSDNEDSDFEDLDTEHFPLMDKCPTPPTHEPPPPYDN